MATHAGQPASLPRLETGHRKLLNPRRPDDSPVTETEYSSDEVLAGPGNDDVIGISISRAQTYMKSPETPAIEKQRVIEQSPDYFNQLPPSDSIPQSSTHGPNASQAESPSSPISPWRAQSPVERRSALGTALDDVRLAAKRRSLSGSNMFENLMKMLPDFPALPNMKSQPFFSNFAVDAATQKREEIGDDNDRLPATATDKSNREYSAGRQPLGQSRSFYSVVTTPKDDSVPETTAHESKSFDSYIGVDTAPGSRPQQPQNLQIETGKDALDSGKVLSPTETFYSAQSKRHSDPTVPPSAIARSPLRYGFDGSFESLIAPKSPGSSRGRRNSESSIYLSRKFSGASAFDDTSVFAHITDMANSRFKAITDSFQSSAIRFPRLQKTIKTHPVRNAGANDETSRNTEINSRSSGREHEKQYNSMPNIKKPKKLIEIETSMNRAHPMFFDALDELQGDLVVMGGYRGSILREAKPPHRQLWAPVKVGLNLRKADLEVGLMREDEERAVEKIIPGGILSHIGPIDICRRLLKYARKCPNAKSGMLRTHDWGYDWRLSPVLLAERLIKFLEGLECNQAHVPADKRGVWIIAHSLGGLITRYAVNLRPELFAGVLYAGTPTNCVNILGPLRNGDNVLLSAKVLTAQVNFTIRTSFALLPEDGRCFIDRETGERYDMDFFDPQTWEDWHLSPCIRAALAPPTTKQRERSKSIVGMMTQSVTNLSRPNFLTGNSDSARSNSHTTPSTGASSTAAKSDSISSHKADMGRQAVVYAENLVAEPIGDASFEPNMSSNAGHKPSVATACSLDPAAAREYLARTLADTLAFKRALVHNPKQQASNRYPPHALMFGKTVPTVYGAKVVSKEAIRYSNAFDDLAFAAGDGVVLASAAQLPDGYRVVKGGRIESDRGHVGLMGDLEGVGRALQALVEGRRRGVGMGCYDSLVPRKT